jgi:hypothetical protein
VLSYLGYVKAFVKAISYLGKLHALAFGGKRQIYYDTKFRFVG